MVNPKADTFDTRTNGWSLSLLWVPRRTVFVKYYFVKYCDFKCFGRLQNPMFASTNSGWSSTLLSQGVVTDLSDLFAVLKEFFFIFLLYFLLSAGSVFLPFPPHEMPNLHTFRVAAALPSLFKVCPNYRHFSLREVKHLPSISLPANSSLCCLNSPTSHKLCDVTALLLSMRQ